MKIALAQIPAEKGNIEFNLALHRKMIHGAAGADVDVIIFPELSLTGYEPELAEALAMSPDDPRLQVFQDLSAQHRITIAAGAPIKTKEGPAIGLLKFQPQQQPGIYFKTFLHADEESFFVSVNNDTLLLDDRAAIALSICYEISVPEHVERAAGEGAKYYVASVAKFTNGIEHALQRLSNIAQRYRLRVLMVNAIGPADGAVCAGKSSVWDEHGILLGQLPEQETGLLIYDTVTQAIHKAPRSG